jgi:putative transposase
MLVLKHRRRAPRLSSFDYKGPYAYFVTCATYQKRTYFTDKAVIDLIILIVKDCGVRTGFDIYVYCFMPDHLHMLLAGDEKSSLHRFMRMFKQESSFAFKNGYGNTLWQRSYYDRVLRTDEMLDDVAWYIINNPVRKGLVDDYKRYAFSGSSLFDISELSGRT